MNTKIAAALVLLAACGSVQTSGDDVPDGWDPTKPYVTASTDAPDSIHLSWSEVDGAASYQVWRAEAEAGPFELITETADPSYDEGGLGHSDVKFFSVIGCDADGTCTAQSNVARGYSSPGTVSLATCSRGTRADEVRCTWSPAEPEVDGVVSYEIYAHVGDDAPTVVGTADGTTGDGAVAPGDLYALSVAVANSETGTGPLSNELAGYAESVVIVYEDSDPVDAARAAGLEQLLESDAGAIDGIAGTMPSLPTILVASSWVASTYAPTETWTGRPTILSSGFASYTDDGKLHNLAASPHGFIAMGYATLSYDGIRAYAPNWGGTPGPVQLADYSIWDGNGNLVTFRGDGELYAAPLFASNYGTQPANDTVEPYEQTPSEVVATYINSALPGVQRLCRFDANQPDWYGCAEEGKWGWFGFTELPDQAPGQVALINFVARFAAL